MQLLQNLPLVLLVKYVCQLCDYSFHIPVVYAFALKWNYGR